MFDHLAVNCVNQHISFYVSDFNFEQGAFFIYLLPVGVVVLLLFVHGCLSWLITATCRSLYCLGFTEQMVVWNQSINC